MPLIERDALIAKIEKEGLLSAGCGWSDSEIEGSVIDMIEDAPTIDPVKWIPVSERLPENSDNVLAYTPPVDNTVGSLEATRGFMVRLGKRTRITHWMPMPEPPKRGVKDEQYADI